MEVEYLAKKRVYEVAKQLNISNKDLIDKLKGIGVEVSNHMASIDDATIEKVTELLAPKKEEKKAEEKPAAPAEAKKAEQPKNNNNNGNNNENNGGQNSGGGSTNSSGNSGNTSGSAKSDLPKTGEEDATAAVTVISLAVFFAAAFATELKRGRCGK